MELKIEKFNYLTENYIELINNLLNFSNEKKILPQKISFCLPMIRTFIEENKLEIIQHSIIHILEHKETILNFSIDSLEDFSDNSSTDSLKNISQLKKMIEENNFNKLNNNEIEILNIIIDIKKKSNILTKDDIIIIQNYIEVMIIILEKIKILFK
jgi:hypothetical protein